MSALQQTNMNRIKNSIDQIILYTKNLRFVTCLVENILCQGKLRSIQIVRRYILGKF